MPVPQLNTEGIDIGNSLADALKMRHEKSSNALLMFQLKKEIEGQKKAELDQVKEELSLAGDFFNKADVDDPNTWDNVRNIALERFPKIKPLISTTTLPSEYFYDKDEATEAKQWNSKRLKAHITRWNMTKEDTLKRDINNLPPEIESVPAWNLLTGEQTLIGVNKVKGFGKWEDYGLRKGEWTLENIKDAKAPPRETFGVKQADGTVKNVEHQWDALSKSWKPIAGIEPKVETFKEGDTKEVKRGEQIITREYKNGKWIEIAKSPQWEPEKETFHGAFTNTAGQTILLLGRNLYVYQGGAKGLRHATAEEVSGMTRVSSSEESALAKLANLRVSEILEKEKEKDTKRRTERGEVVVPPAGVDSSRRLYEAYKKAPQ